MLANYRHLAKSKITTCVRMQKKHILFFIINFFMCGIARIAINLLPLKFLAVYFGRFQKTLKFSTLISQHQCQQARSIGQSVRLAAKYTPWNSSCLTQAMVAKFWCKFYRIPYMFYIGFKSSTTEKSGYAAHAWITAGPIAITGGDGLMEFHVVSSYEGIYSV